MVISAVPVLPCVDQPQKGGEVAHPKNIANNITTTVTTKILTRDTTMPPLTVAIRLGVCMVVSMSLVESWL